MAQPITTMASAILHHHTAVAALIAQALLLRALAVVARAEASLVADTQAVAVVTLVEEDK